MYVGMCVCMHVVCVYAYRLRWRYIYTYIHTYILYYLGLWDCNFLLLIRRTHQCKGPQIAFERPSTYNAKYVSMYVYVYVCMYTTTYHPHIRPQTVANSYPYFVFAFILRMRRIDKISTWYMYVCMYMYVYVCMHVCMYLQISPIYWITVTLCLQQSLKKFEAENFSRITRAAPKYHDIDTPIIPPALQTHIYIHTYIHTYIQYMKHTHI